MRERDDKLSRFNYYELMNTVKDVCTQHPGVNQVSSNRYLANGAGDIHYPIICITPGEVVVEERQTTYNLNLLYADRLTEARDNLIQIHSVGITTLVEITNALKKYFASFDTERAIINVFNGQFADETAGVLANVTITTIADLGECEWFCPEPNTCKVNEKRE